MYILGIETSCDETGVAIYDSSFIEKGEPAHLGLISQALFSQVEMHQEYGGVVPELASRDHVRQILPLIDLCLKDAELRLCDLNTIAYTQGPGLAGALLVGTSIAKSIAYSLNIAAIGIHHLEGHLLSPLLSPNLPAGHIHHLFPFLALLVSGGHTQIMLVKGVGEYELLGETLDDAAGEAFDKTSKLLGLGYPGGPLVSALALKGKPSQIRLPRPLLHSKNLDFSFAGLKTAVLTQVKLSAQLPKSELEQFKADLALDFVNSVVDVLTAKVLQAAKETGCQRLVVAGGVGANQQLRESLNKLAHHPQLPVTTLYPPLNLCTDNGAMIAFAATLQLLKNSSQIDQSLAFNVKPRWTLGN
jgi:N6-L-threonylcarbamoyladenine synthase